MRILYISKYAATPASGHPTRQYFFSKSLAECGNTVLLIYSNSNGAQSNGNDRNEMIREINNSLFVQKLKGPNIKLGMNLKRIWSWILFEYRLYKNYQRIKDFQPDIIIVSSLSILTFLSGVHLKKYLKRPLILEVRDLYPLTLTEIGGLSKYNPVVQILGVIEKYGYRNANLIISTLENTKSYFETKIVSPVDFKWIPMGVDLELYKSSPDIYSLNTILKIKKLKSEKSFIVAYAGSIGKANALEEVLRLSIDHEFANNQIHFVIIGNGPLKEKYKELYARGKISFFNSINKMYLPLALKECDLLINTWLDKKIYQYGISPNKWIEYMYAGRPILLAFNGRSSIFDEADCGWLVPAENITLLKKEILKISSLPRIVLDRKGQNGKEYLFSHLSYSKLTKDLEKTLQDCLVTYNNTERNNEKIVV